MIEIKRFEISNFSNKLTLILTGSNPEEISAIQRRVCAVLAFSVGDIIFIKKVEKNV